MLSEILSKDDCASCKFCCSFRRQSLWETPLFKKEDALILQKKFPHARFKTCGKNSLTIDLSEEYKTSDPDEEVPCPFLDKNRGCVLERKYKPFDCSIWPLRAARVADSEEVCVVLTATCPAINRLPKEQVASFVHRGLDKIILKHADENPDIIKPWNEKFVLL